MCIHFCAWGVEAFGGGSSFDSQQEAFQLAQDTQAYRMKLFQQGRSIKNNLGYASITITYTDGTKARRYVQLTSDGSPLPFAGYDPYTSHSEFFAHGWVKGTLRSLRQSGTALTHVASVDIVIFSQVRVCDDCRKAMVGWLREFKVDAGTDAVSLTIWQLTRGFDPAKLQQGRSVTSPSDVSPVPIPFDQSSPFSSPTP